jgi:hypothetical protein
MLTDDILQLHSLQVVPDPLIRVQLRSVGWQLLQVDSLPGRAGQKSFDLLAAVDGLPSQMTSSRTEMWVVRCLRKRAASLPRKGRSCTLVCSQPWG